jgi:hypothetical protein
MQGFQVTLTDADTNYDLLALVRAIDSAFIDFANQITLQADDANSGTILIGDSNLSDTRYGVKLSVTDALALGVGSSLRGINARSASSGQKLNIFVAR